MKERRVYMYQVTQLENCTLDELTELLNEIKNLIAQLIEEYRATPKSMAGTMGAGEITNTRRALLQEISRAISRKYFIIQARTVLLKRIRLQRSRQKRFSKIVTPEEARSKRGAE